MPAANDSTSAYVGRFAPSPTGPLHFGSAVAAFASFLQARTQRGRWLVRIDDIDPPRELVGAARNILDALVALGLEWDGEVTYQSARSQVYDEALSQLAALGLTFDCACSRRQVGRGPYPGTCRSGVPPGATVRSRRVRVEQTMISFVDRLQGVQRQELAREVGDFVLRRADGLYAYHLAVVIDDAAAGVTEIVRGVDLLDSTPRQIYLQSVLNLPTPGYVHVPVVLNEAGTKLSKQTFAAPIDPALGKTVLVDALRFLQQDPPVALYQAEPVAIIDWAIAHWKLSRVGQKSRPLRNLED